MHEELLDSAHAMFPPALESIPTLSGTDTISYEMALAYCVKQAEEEISCPELPTGSCCCSKRQRDKFRTVVWPLMFKMSRIRFSSEDAVHRAILNSLFVAITGRSPPEELKSSEWMKIGFQGRNPGTDVRAGGILTILIPLWLFQNAKLIGNKAIQTMFNDDETTQLMIILINLVAAAIEASGTTDLLTGCGSSLECWERFLHFFAGEVEILCEDILNNLVDLQKDFAKIYRLMSTAKSRPLTFAEKGKKSM